jgi:uncharacterized protein YecE (DUF72 family)
MEFGRVANVARVDFTLAPDRRCSSLATTAHTTDARIGLPLWGKKEFVGTIYPAGTKSADFLRAYGARFSTIELNATHYRMPEVDRIRAWCNEVPETFLFCPKVPQTISHSFAANVREMQTFAERVAEFGQRLGPCLLQFPEYADTLALELRHPVWFDDEEGLRRLADYLCARNIALVITDSAGRRDVVHMMRTAPFTFVRFLGNGLHTTDFARIDAWRERLREWQAQGSQNYFFLHQPNEVECMPLFERMTSLEMGTRAALDCAP